MTGCTHLDELLESEKKIIKRHIEEHKYYQHIENDEAAIMDFIEKYGFIMREYYCEYVCADRMRCEIAEEYRRNK